MLMDVDVRVLVVKFLRCRALGSIVFINKNLTTVSGGSLGSCIDEERGQLR